MIYTGLNVGLRTITLVLFDGESLDSTVINT